MSQASTKQKFSILSLMFALVLMVLPWIHSDVFMDSALTPKFAVLSLFVAIILGISIFKKSSTFFRISIPALLLGAYVLWQLISIIWAFNFAEALFSSSTSLLLFASFFIAQLVLNERAENEEIIYYAACISAVGLCLLGWYEFFSLSDISKQSNVYDVKGFASHKNLFILQLFLHLPLVIIAGMKAKGILRYAISGLVVLCTLLMFSLLARAFLLGFVATILVASILFFLTRGDQKKAIPWKPILIGASITIVGLFALYSTRSNVDLLKRYDVTKFANSRNAKERLALWGNSVEMIKDNPVLGCGAGNWDIFYVSKGIGDITRLSNEKLMVSRPHNDYIWITAETGLVGIGLYLAMILSVYFTGLIGVFKSNNTVRKDRLIVLIAFFTGYLIIAFFDFPKERIELNFLLALLIALICYNAFKINENQFAFTLDGKKLKMLSGLFLLSMVFLMYFAWNRYLGEQFLKKIVKLSNSKNYSAVTALHKNSKNVFYNITPNEMTIPYYICYAYFKLENRKKVVEVCQESLDCSPHNIKSIQLIAAAYASDGAYETAVEYFQKSYDINPTNEEVERGLIISLYNSKQYDRAREIAKNVDSDNPTILQIKENLDLTK